MANLKRKLDIYEQLFQAYGPGDSACQIGQLALLLHVSERHVQTLIKNMVSAGWIEWKASSGRHKKALLTCRVEPIDACYEVARILADEGKVEKLLDTLSFGGRDASREFQSFLTYSNRSIRRIAFLPFHRELEPLLVHKVRRRTERFLVTQICQRLIAIEQGRVMGDLAYHWQPNEDATVWLFHIRSGVRFHDGTTLKAQDVARCLNALVQSAYWRSSYRHINEVIALSDEVIEVRLHQTDWHLPRLLARAEASIFQATSSVSSYRLVGSGPFILDVFSAKMLRLNRNVYYPLNVSILDRVELWVYPEWAKSKACAQNKLVLEVPELTHAYHSVKRATFLMIQNPSLSESRHRHFTFEDTAECKKLFSQLSSLDDQGTLVDYGDHSQPEDITLCSIIEENDAFSSWLHFLSQYPYEKHDLDSSILKTIDSSLVRIRSERDLIKADTLLAELRCWLYEQGVITELKQEAFSLDVSEKIKGVQINGYGWCELNKIWILDS